MTSAGMKKNIVNLIAAPSPKMIAKIAAVA